MDQKKNNTNDLWEQIGFLADGEPSHVLTRLFTSYEKMLESDPHSLEAENFFKKLATAIAETSECNVNRR